MGDKIVKLEFELGKKNLIVVTVDPSSGPDAIETARRFFSERIMPLLDKWMKDGETVATLIIQDWIDVRIVKIEE